FDPAAPQHVAGDFRDRSGTAQILDAPFVAENPRDGGARIPKHLQILLNAVADRRKERELAELGRRQKSAIWIVLVEWRRRIRHDELRCPALEAEDHAGVGRRVDDLVDLKHIVYRRAVDADDAIAGADPAFRRE